MHGVQQQQQRVRGDILVATSSDLQAFIILAASVVQINAIKNVVLLFTVFVPQGGFMYLNVVVVVCQQVVGSVT